MALFELPPRTCSVATGEATPTPSSTVAEVLEPAVQFNREAVPSTADVLPNGMYPAGIVVNPVPPLETCTGTAKDVPQAAPVDTAMPAVGYAVGPVAPL